MLCLTTAALSLALPLQNFTLAWTHSIEKIRWEEDYEVRGAVLYLTEARVRGTGAGMEIPDGASLRDGVWHYRPDVNTFEFLTLARSPYTADYELCQGGECKSMREVVGTVEQSPQVRVFPCRAAG